VAILFSVERRDDKPLGRLTASEIEIYERNQPVPASVTRQRLVGPDGVVGRHVLLLVDLALCDLSERSLQAVIDAGGAFVERLAKGARVAVYGFDGRPEITEVAGFSQDAQALKDGLAALKKAGTRDPSSDINGSVVKALDALKAEMKRSALPVRWGTVVLITNGKDLARRLSRREMVEALDAAKVQRHAVGVGDAVDQGLLDAVGADGAYRVNLGTEPKPVVTEEDKEKGVTPTGPPGRPLLSETLDRLAAAMERRARGLRILSYCSPLRAGEHYVRVKITQGEASGEFSFKIDASGFGPGCDPKKIPTF
jgi:hypothetical protein